jgi:hypothetical protein
VLQFLAAPAAIVDVSCVDELPGPQFAPGDPGDPALVPIEVDLSGVDQPSLRSSAPGEWYEFDDGVWYRDRSFLDHSS